MQYLIAQGSSIRKIFVHCADCGKKQVWMRLFPDLIPGTYRALCAPCRKEAMKNEAKPDWTSYY